MPYIGKTTDGFGIRERFTYLASAGATSISGADANGKTLLYEDPEYVDVFLNGIRLKKGTDYNTSTANTIAGLAALAADDEIEVIVQDVFTLADMVSANTGGDFRGSIAIQKDSGAISFGADKEITLTHDADKGLKLKNTSTTGNSGVGAVLTLQTGDTDITTGNVLGDIQFQAPDEGTGTDAILVAAAIKAMSEGDFSSSSNATKLSFHTAASAAAAETMSLSSAGDLTVSGTYTGGGLMTTGGNIIIPDDGAIGSASDTNAIAISSAGVVTLSTNTDSTSSTSGALIAHSAGFADDVFIGDTLNIAGSNGVDISQGAISIKNGGAQSYVRFYCESSNAHYAQLQAPAHADFSDNITLTLPAVTDTIAGIAATQTLTNKTLTSPKINENVAVTATATELNLLDGVTATTAEINFLDGGSTIGTTAIADGDGIIHNDGGTMKVTSAATFKTYFQTGVSIAADDISAGDAAVNITTSSGNITIDAAANDSDIIFKGTDNTADITMLTLDGSEAGAASFNGTVTANAGVIVDNITIDGTEIDLSSGDLTLDVAGDIMIDAGGGDIRFADDGTTVGKITISANDFVLDATRQDQDIIFKGDDGGVAITALTLDMSEAGAATFNSSVTMSTSLTGQTTDGQFEFISKDTSGSGSTDYGDFIFKGVRGADGDSVTIMNMDGATGRVGINTTSMSEPLRVQADSGTDFSASSANFNTAVMLKNSTSGASNCISLGMSTETNGEVFISAVQNSDNDAADFVISTRDSGARAERARLDSEGRFFVGTNTTTLTGQSGLTVQKGGSGNTIGLISASQLGGIPFIANRNSDDGTVIQIRQNNGVEGSISVSGNTTSYNAFSGSHWSRLSDNSKPTILKGTVIETIDEMCDWYRVKFTVAKTEEKEEYTEQISIALPSGKKEGDTISYTHEGITYDDAVIVKENDNKHTKCKISDTADSKRVYGVFADWDSDDDTVNDMYVTALGTHVVRINKDITVQAGDLLSSNGDGTAKVQDDDIIRSKTIGKVLTNIKQETYDDGSYTVPCALYCG